MTACAAWPVAVERYEAGYGEPLDLSDPQCRVAFLGLLEAEVRNSIERETDATATIEARTARLGGER